MRGVQDGLRPAISPRTTPSCSYSGLFIVTWRAIRARCRVALRSASAQVRDMHRHLRRGQANARCGVVGVTYARRVPHWKAVGISRTRHSGPVLRVSEQRIGSLLARWRCPVSLSTRHFLGQLYARQFARRAIRAYYVRVRSDPSCAACLEGVFMTENRCVLDTLAMMPQTLTVRRHLPAIHTPEILL